MLFEKFDRRDVLGNFRASTSAATNVTDYEVMFNGALPEAVVPHPLKWATVTTPPCMGVALSELLPLLNVLIASKYPRTNSTSGKPHRR
jgi:hypothetical protein